MLPLKLESLQYLDGKAPDQTLRYSLEIVAFDKLVQVHAQTLESYHEVLSEEHVVFDSDDVVLVVWVVVVQVLEDPKLNACLILELLLVTDQLDGHRFLSLVVQARDGLAKASLP